MKFKIGDRVKLISNPANDDTTGNYRTLEIGAEGVITGQTHWSQPDDWLVVQVGKKVWGLHQNDKRWVKLPADLASIVKLEIIRLQGT